ncbi:MAG: hypothetical protein VB835_14460 [Pirellulales bacterium]|nr:hypothetical protein [Planctomycetota bacterium]
MGLSGILLAAVVTVPPGELVVDHSQPYHWTQPTVRRFERREEDESRQANWELYVRELDALWKAYRRGGSTPRAWQDYKRQAGQAKRRFIVNDPYYLPIVREAAN